MRLLANENISASVVAELRRLGHDILWAKESMRGDPDELLLSRAQAEVRIVLTHDKDFGELAFRHGYPAECGIILVRLAGDDCQTDINRTVEAISSRDDWAGHFSVIEAERIRI